MRKTSDLSYTFTASHAGVYRGLVFCPSPQTPLLISACKNVQGKAIPYAL